MGQGLEIYNIMEFKFDPDKHLYTLGGKPITGVTTIIGIINKPWLVPWSAKMVVEWIREHATKKFSEEFQTTMYTLSDQQLDEAKFSHQRKKEKAGDIGTKVHKWIEDFINAKINKTTPPEIQPEFYHITRNFVQWSIDNKVKFIASEKRLYSKTYWYAGTMDFVCEIDGKIWIGDIKTGSGIAPEAFFQMAAYQNALQEMEEYPEIEGNVVLNCKKDGNFEVQRSYGFKQNFESFLACLKIYRTMEELKITTK